MAELKVREWRLGDADHLIPRLRASDVAEWAALSTNDIGTELRGSVARSSLVWTGTVDDEPAFVFGVCPKTNALINATGRVWLVGTDRMAEVRRAFVRRSRGYAQFMLTKYPILENWVDARNTTARAWLRWCGFTEEPATAVGLHGELFHRFWISGEVA